MTLMSSTNFSKQTQLKAIENFHGKVPKVCSVLIIWENDDAIYVNQETEILFGYISSWKNLA